MRSIKGSDFTKNGLIKTEALSEFIKDHRAEVPKYLELKRMYMNDANIFRQRAKQGYKPDNRLAVPFSKYLVDIFTGYFAGIPVKVNYDDRDDETDDKLINQAISKFWNKNAMNDTFSEIAKLTSLYGHAYIYLWQDENAETRCTWLSPLNTFVVYDNSIQHKAVFGCRYWQDEDRNIKGELLTADYKVEFEEIEGDLIIDWGDVEELFYATVPIIEFVENEEKIGLLDGVSNLINKYNKVISEKANDVDYFADAYLAVTGVELDEKDILTLRDSRLINLYGRGIDNAKVEFLSKPNADETQENLLDRLERLIYQTSMVVNLNDESFGTRSGIALELKMQSMQNMAFSKQNKFTKSFYTLFENVFAIPTNGIPESKKDSWIDIDFKYTLNMPKNLESEAEVARALEGVVSQKTQLSTLSIVDNVNDEVERIQKENENVELY